MFSVLVLVAGAVIAEAGITHVPNGFGFHQPSSHFLRPTIRAQFTNPIGPSQIKLGPILSHVPVFTNTFVSPAAFKSALYSYNVPKFHPMPISHVGLRPTSTITHISPPVVRNFLKSPLNSFVPAPILNLPISHVISPAIITKQQIPATVINFAPTNQVAKGPGLINTQNTLNSTSSYETVHEVQEIPEKAISYSLSEQDYLYLKRHKVEELDSPYNPEFTNPEPIKLENPHSHHDQDKAASRFQPSSDSDLIKRSPVPNQVYSADFEPSIANTPERSPVPNQAYSTDFEPSIANTPAPIIFKHIYFHVPQPEFEEPSPTVNLPPPKKTYNILFIKAPTQESQNHAYLQQQQRPQIEDKTLIYVLSKKQDPVEVVVPPQETRPSSPEVYFVKYQTNFGDVDPRNTGSVVEETVLEGISPVLDRKRSVDQKPNCKTETKTR